MLTECEMTQEDMNKAVSNGALCVVCQERVSVAWGGHYNISSYVLKCSNPNHTGITRHDKKEENKKKEYFSVDSTALQTMTETQMVQRVEMARFPQELTPADKRLLAQVAITYGFDPLMKEISIYQGNPFVSIDGRYRKAQETGKLDGVSTRPATEQERKDWGILATDYFFKAEVMVVGAKYPFVGWGRVFQSETQVRPGKPGDAYKPTVTNPQRMAEKRAEAQALRKAFHIPLPSIEDIEAPDDEPTTRVVDVSTGEVTEKLPEPPAPPETQPGGKLGLPAVPPGLRQAGDCGVDMERLRENCKKIKWSDAVCMSWIEASFKVKRAETLEQTIAMLDKDQKAKLYDFVSKAAGIK